MSTSEEKIINNVRDTGDVWSLRNHFDMVPTTMGSAAVGFSAAGIAASGIFCPVILTGFIFGFVASATFTLETVNSISDKLIDSNVPLRFFHPSEDENTYDDFLKRIYPSLTPGALLIDTTSNTDSITITYKLDDEHKLEWRILKSSVIGNDILQAERRSEHRVNSDEKSLKLSILLMSKEDSPVFCYHSKKRRSRATKWNYGCTLATGIAGAIIVASLGFPPLGLALLGLCIFAASMIGTTYGAFSYKLHKQSQSAQSIKLSTANDSGLLVRSKKVADEYRRENNALFSNKFIDYAPIGTYF